MGMTSKRFRIAAIDVGTNSVHMIVAEKQGRGFRVVDKEKEMVQLGRGSLGGHPLADDAIDRAVAALKRMVAIARSLKVNQVDAVATSAVREAPNAPVFLQRVRDEVGIEVSVVSGEDEADLIFRAVRAAVDFDGGTALCIDIGGGSVELVIGTRTEVFFTASLPLGVLWLSQQFFATDPPTDESLARCRRFIRKRLKKILPTLRSIAFDFVIGTSGTIVTLAHLSTPGEVEEVSAGLRWLEAPRLEGLIDTMSRLSARERSAQLGIESRRAETILAGALLLDEILRLLRVEWIRACSAALREGIVIRALEGRQQTDPGDVDVRRDAVLALAERSESDDAHGSHVARLAIEIFNQTRELHGLGDPHREILEYAALLHEIGLHVSYQRHHKHSYYIIRHAGLEGFTEDQIAVLANVARYHRKAPPSREHPNYRELTRTQRDVVKKLAAILRLAEGLDRGRRQVVRGVAVRTDRRHVLLSLQTRIRPTVELDDARKGARYFARLFDRKVELTVDGSG